MEHKPYRSKITPEKILNFELGKYSTYTGYEIVDVVMETIYSLESPSAKSVARHLGIDQTKLTYTMEVCAGYNLGAILEMLRMKRLREVLLANIDKPMDEIAHKAGFCNRAAVKRVFKNPKYARFFCRHRPQNPAP